MKGAFLKASRKRVALELPLALFALGLGTGVASAATTFAAATNLPAPLGTNPRGVSIADLNGDGKSDLVVANYTTGTVTVRLGNGDGTFGTGTNYSTGGKSTYYAVPGDFNGDGKLDLIVANKTNNSGVQPGNVGVLRGNGNGTFQSVLTSSAGSEPISVAVGNFNNDGRLDAVVANLSTNRVTVLLGNGNGTLTAANFYVAGSGSPVGSVSVAVGDFNGDGKLDVAGANYINSQVRVWSGNGDGTLLAPLVLPMGSGSGYVIFGDLNKDGKLDLATANTSSNSVSVRLNSGNGNFGSLTNYSGGSGPNGVAVGDFNGDGNPDLAIANSGNATVSVREGNGSGTFGSPLNFSLADGPSDIKVGDFNGDGRLDLATANFNGSASVLINSYNNAPTVANALPDHSADEDVAFTFEVPANTFSDADGDILTYSATLADGTPLPAWLSFNGVTSKFTGTPAQSDVTILQVKVTAQDGKSSVSDIFTLTVNAVNDAPVAVDDKATVAEDDSVDIDAKGNDTDADGDALTITTATATHGTAAINADGTIKFTPDADYNGAASVSYTVSDGKGGEDNSTVEINVTPVNDLPVGNNDTASTDEDTPVTINAKANDTDVDDDALTVTAVTQGTKGSVAINSDGTITYTPNADFNGEDTFSYTISDGKGGVDATVTVTVKAVNDAPVAKALSVKTDEDAAIAITLSGTDVEGDALTFAIGDAPKHGTLSGSGADQTYTPDADFNGDDSFTYVVNDGKADSAPVKVSITVKPVNDAPVAANDSVTTNEDTEVSGTLQASDVDGDNLTYNKVSGPSHGTVTVNADGTFTYTPAANYNGDDSFTFKANDGTVDSADATVNITVKPVNDAPVAGNDNAATSAATPVDGNVLSNDTDIDSSALTATVVTQPAHGKVQLNANGAFTYTPAIGFSGTDSFTYRTSDGTDISNIATVTIVVTQPATTSNSKVTGGGTISGVNGGLVNFTLNVQTDNKTGALKGKVDYGSSMEGVYIRSTSITGLVITGTKAQVFGKATLNGGGSYDFVVDVTDNGEPGDADTFHIRLSNSFGNGPKTLDGGKIQVHK